MYFLQRWVFATSRVGGLLLHVTLLKLSRPIATLDRALLTNCNVATNQESEIKYLAETVA